MIRLILFYAIGFISSLIIVALFGEDALRSILSIFLCIVAGCVFGGYLIDEIRELFDRR